MHFVILLLLLPLSALGITFEQVAAVALGSGTISWSSPAVDDLNDDGILDAVVGLSEGMVVAVSSDGSILWKRRITKNRCAKAKNYNEWDKYNDLLSTPTIANLTGGQKKTIIVGYGGLYHKECDGGVVALNGKNGDIEWKFSTKAWAKKTKTWAEKHGVVSTPAVKDVDGDGKKEIGFGSLNRHVFILNYDGSVRRVYHTADTVFSSPIFTQGGKIIFGSDITANKMLKPKTKNGGILSLMETSQRTGTIPFRSELIASLYVDQVIHSSPVIGDVDITSDGNGVIFGSGCYFPERNYYKRGNWIKVVKANTLEELHTLPINQCMSQTPAVGDLNGDGVLDIVGGTFYPESYQVKSQGIAYTVKDGTPKVLWSKRIRDPAIFQSPVILNGESPVVLFPHSGGALVIDGKTGNKLPPLYTKMSSKSNLAIGDINGDLVPDLVVAGNFKGYSGKALIKFYIGKSDKNFSFERHGNWRTN